MGRTSLEWLCFFIAAVQRGSSLAAHFRHFAREGYFWAPLNDRLALRNTPRERVELGTRGFTCPQPQSPSVNRPVAADRRCEQCSAGLQGNAAPHAPTRKLEADIRTFIDLHNRTRSPSNGPSLPTRSWLPSNDSVTKP